MSQVIESDLWVMSTLGEALVRSDERVNPSLTTNTENYIGLEHIESGTGRLLDISATSSEELKSTKNVFHPGDILYGKLRPYLNKVYYAEGNGVCSTDIWVLRATPLIDPVYASYYLRSAIVLEQVNQLTTGVNLPRVNAAVFDRIAIPLPPLSEQRRIATILRKAEEMGKLRLRANEKIQEIVQSLFYHAFGDPAINEGKWETIALSDIVADDCPITYGIVQPGTEAEQGIPIVRPIDLTQRVLDVSNLKKIDEAIARRYSRSELRGFELLISVRGQVGLLSIADQRLKGANVTRGIVPLWFNSRADIVYVYYLLKYQSMQKILEDMAVGIALKQVNLNDLRKLMLPIPPVELQKKFVAKVLDIWEIEARQTEMASYISILFQSLLAQAFNGELTATWREAHIAELTREARARDALLENLRGAALTVVATRPFIQFIERERTELVDELTESQIVLLTFITRQLENYFSAIRLYDAIGVYLDDQGRYQPELDPEGFYANFAGLDSSLDALRRDLHVLASLGLIKEATLPLEDDTGVMRFVTAYRSLRAEDDVQQDDLNLLGDETTEEVVA